MTLTEQNPVALTPAIGYIRVSLAREEMISPELQRTAILSWAGRTRHHIIDWVEDLDMTGRNFKRKIMQVIERVERGDAKVIAVWKYSRFGRNRPGIELNLARIEQAGGNLLSATEEVDTSTAAGWFQRDVLFSVAAFESLRAGEQWKEAQEARRKHGLPAHGKPRFGYVWYPRKVYQPDGSVTIQEERYEVGSEDAEALRSCYVKYIAGESFYALALRLNEQGHRTVRGDLWTAKAIRRYMDSGFAAGYLRLHEATCKSNSAAHHCNNYRLERHPTNAHPSVISDTLWGEYLDRRAFTKTAAPRARAAQYHLTGLCICKNCRQAAVRKVDGRKSPSRICIRRRERGPRGCEGASVIEPLIIAEVKRFLASFASEIEAAAAATTSVAPSPAITRDRRLSEIESELSRLDRAIAKHMRVYALADDGDGTLEEAYLATLKELRGSRAALVSEQGRLQTSGSVGSLEDQREALTPVALGLLAEWDTLDPGAVNVLLRRLIGRIEVGRGSDVVIVPVWDAS